MYTLHLIVSLIQQLLCPVCKSGPLTLHEHSLGQGSVGFHSQLKVKCQKCDDYVAVTLTSDLTKNKGSTTNMRAVASARNCGIGFSQLINFFTGMNVPQPMYLRTFKRITNEVWLASRQAMQDCFKSAIKTVRNLYAAKDPTITDTIIDISVSYDGSWHRRGYSSHFGVDTIIELQTGLVIDTHVMSNHCYMCVRNIDPSDTWLENHKTVFIRKTFTGRLVLWR